MSKKADVFYIAGPMSGIPHFNVPAFHRAVATLRRKHPDEVYISPADMDTPTMQAYALASEDGDVKDLEEVTRETWGQVLGRDVELVADHVQNMVLLYGWEKSKGARLEATVGLLCGHDFFLYEGGDRYPTSREWVAHRILLV
jgi:hypothetical protein